MINPRNHLDLGESATLYCGDCLEVLDTIPDGSISAVVTDPPYGINTKSDGKGKPSPWADLTNSAYWYSAWLSAVRSKLRPDGCAWTCLNWRSMVTFVKASCDIGWPIESLLVWDKRWISTGSMKGLRPSYELVALWAMPEFQIPNRGLPDVQPFPWSSRKPHGHPAEKPVALMQWLIEQSTQPGDVILDLFMGSGTTGEAAITSGRRYVGVELDEAWYQVSVDRLKPLLPDDDTVADIDDVVSQVQLDGVFRRSDLKSNLLVDTLATLQGIKE